MNEVVRGEARGEKVEIRVYSLGGVSGSPVTFLVRLGFKLSFFAWMGMFPAYFWELLHVSHPCNVPGMGYGSSALLCIIRWERGRIFGNRNGKDFFNGNLGEREKIFGYSSMRNNKKRNWTSKNK